MKTLLDLVIYGVITKSDITCTDIKTSLLLHISLINELRPFYNVNVLLHFRKKIILCGFRIVIVKSTAFRSFF